MSYSDISTFILYSWLFSRAICPHSWIFAMDNIGTRFYFSRFWSYQRNSWNNYESLENFQLYGSLLTIVAVQSVDVLYISAGENIPLSQWIQADWAGSGPDGRLIIPGEGTSTVVHDGAKIVGDTLSGGHICGQPGELVFKTYSHVRDRDAWYWYRIMKPPDPLSYNMHVCFVSSI